MTRVNPLFVVQNFGANAQQQTTPNNPIFKGNPKIILNGEDEKVVLDQANKLVNSQFGWMSKLAKKLAINDGEFQNNVINAVFTTTLAPLFIAYNPFAHQDKKTKEYAALRQPISAIIALGCVLPMTAGVNKFLDFYANNGFSQRLDLRMSPSDSYFIPQFKKEYKNAPDKAKFLAQYEKGISNEILANKNSKAYFIECKTNYIKAKRAERENLFAKLIAQRKENVVVEGAENIIYIVKNGVKEEVGRNIPNLTHSNLQNYLKENSIYEKKVKDFMMNEFGFEFAQDGTFKPFTIDNKLKQINASEFLTRIGLLNDISEEDLHRIMTKIRSEDKLQPDLEKILSDIYKVENGNEALSDTFGKHMTRVVHTLHPRSSSDKISLHYLFHRYGLKDEKLQEFFNQNIAQGWETLKSKLKNKGLKEIDNSDDIAINTLNIIKNNAKKTAAHYKGFKQYFGIFSNLFITAISCYILNWIYPRAIERLFPSLIKDDQRKIKTDKEGGKN